jgi:glycosyltransferase involved in cell wall biosynthesis
LPSVDDPYRAKLQQGADQAGVGDRLRFRIITRSQLRSAYSEADVCVFPTEWDEPFGLVPLEAMACGTPVVATGSGGSGEFLFDGDNCLRFPEKDPGGLAAAIRRLAEDPDLRKRLVDGGLRTAQELGVDQLTDVLERWHLAAADRFAGGRPRHRLLAIL